MTKERLIYLDIIRIFAFLCVFVVHFNASVCGWDIFGKFVYPNYLIPSHYYGCYLGTIGVGLFFLLTGACLQYVYVEKAERKVGLLLFYKKRWLSLFPSYYITFFVFTLFSFIWYKSYPDFNWGHLLTSFVGMDGYLMTLRNVGYETYQCGEWFLGCILCLYAIYPALSWAANKFPKTTSVITVLAYLWPLGSGIKDIWFPLQIPYLLSGIFFIKYFRTTLSWKLWIPALILISIRVVFGKYMASHTIHLITCWFVFLVITLLTELVEKYTGVLKSEKVLRAVSFFSVLTYPLFLAHHKIITVLAQQFDLTNFPYRYTVLLFCVYTIIASCVSYWIYKMERRVKKVLSESCLYTNSVMK